MLSISTLFGEILLSCSCLGLLFFLLFEFVDKPLRHLELFFLREH